MLETYTLPQIKEAVDIAVGDDGFRSEEVIEILKQSEKSRYEDTLDRVRETKMGVKVSSQPTSNVSFFSKGL